MTEIMQPDVLRRKMMAKTVRSRLRDKFSLAEDRLLGELVAKNGTNRWDLIASLMKTKNQRQCHDRWVKYLSPSIKKEPWTADEDRLLIKLLSERGVCWVQLAKYFPNRTDVQLKNRWNILKRKSFGQPICPTVYIQKSASQVICPPKLIRPKAFSAPPMFDFPKQVKPKEKQPQEDENSSIFSNLDQEGQIFAPFDAEMSSEFDFAM